MVIPPGTTNKANSAAATPINSLDTIDTEVSNTMLSINGRRNYISLSKKRTREQSFATTIPDFPYPSKSATSVLSTVSSIVCATIEQSDQYIVYCDGASKGNGTDSAIAGIGVWWGPDDPRYVVHFQGTDSDILTSYTSRIEIWLNGAPAFRPTIVLS